MTTRTPVRIFSPVQTAFVIAATVLWEAPMLAALLMSLAGVKTTEKLRRAMIRVRLAFRLRIGIPGRRRNPAAATMPMPARTRTPAERAAHAQARPIPATVMETATERGAVIVLQATLAITAMSAPMAIPATLIANAT